VEEPDPFQHPLDEPHPPFEPFEAPAAEGSAPAQDEIADQPVEAESVQAEEPVATEQPAMEEPAAAEAVTEPAPAEEQAQPASYWKCPSCGVVNGSTATSCRMCFTARP
jgi:hypothetical protein